MTHGSSMRGEPIFILDAPHYHRVSLGARHRFRGLALANDGAGRVLQALVVREDGVICQEAAVDGESADVARILPHVAAASRCRFAFDMPVHASTYAFHGRFDDGAEMPLFVFDAAGATAACAMLERAGVTPLPPADLLLRTQGGDDAEAYRDSIISAHHTLRTLLRLSGIDPATVRRVLDIGCGTGRLLAGWHLDDGTRELVGVDIDGDCIAWASAHLPGVAEWHASAVDPPLPFGDGSFDVVQLASVFTHLSSERQDAWVRELARLVRGGGAIVVTLHGEPYTWMLGDADRRRLAAAGHLELNGGVDGSSEFRTFHETWYARRLFGQRFSRVDYYRGGQPSFPPRLFPLSSLQDVYILHI